MSLITGCSLKRIMEDDVYYAIPYSVVQWLNTFDLSASSRLIIERMISAALQRPSRSERHLQVRLSISLIAQLTSIKERTVVNALSALEKKGLTHKVDVNNNGTLYQINLSSKILDLMKIRYKAPSPSSVEKTEVSDQARSPDLTQDRSQEIQSLQDKIKEIELKKAELSVNMPENFSPRQLLKGGVEFDTATLERLSQLKQMQSKLESTLSELRRQPEPTPLPAPPSVKTKPPAPPRFVRPCDAKALSTRIGNLPFVRSPGQKHILFKEALWALRYGWYCQFEGSTFHCVNHIIKLLKNNDWRTPSQFKPQQIEGLIKYYDLGESKG